MSRSHTLDDQIGAEDSHAANTDTGLSGTVGGSEAGEDDGGRAAQRTKEGLERAKVSDAVVQESAETRSRDGAISRVPIEEAGLTA